MTTHLSEPMPTHATTYIPEWWKETTLGEVVEITSSKRIFAEEYMVSWVPFYRGKEIIEKFNGWKISTELYITEEKYTEIELKFWAPKSGDMLLTSVGTIWVPYIVKNQERFYFKDWNLTWFRNFSGILNVFLFYWLTSEYGKEEIQRHKIWSTQEALTIVWLKSIMLSIPPLPEQVAIADMLSSFDAKIELLREQNETLEKTAQTIFYEWFGKYSVEYPEELPEGWRVGKLSEIASFLNWIALQKYPPENEIDYLPVIKIRELKAGITEQSDKASKNIDPKYIIDNGDILFSWSWSLEVGIWQHGKWALNQHLFKVSSNNYPKWFYYFWTTYHLPEFKEIAANKATTMWHIQRHHLDLAIVIIPDWLSLGSFSKIMEPILEKLILTHSQIQSLSKARDELLPRLMSGEVRVGV